MSPKSKYLNDAKKNVIELRYKLARHESAGTEPPASILNELKMAELLLKLESIDTIKFKPKVMYELVLNNQKELFFTVQSYLWALQDHLELYKKNGLDPPEYLLNNLEGVKRQLEIISESLFVPQMRSLSP